MVFCDIVKSFSEGMNCSVGGKNFESVIHVFGEAVCQSLGLIMMSSKYKTPYKLTCNIQI